MIVPRYSKKKTKKQQHTNAPKLQFCVLFQKSTEICFVVFLIRLTFIIILLLTWVAVNVLAKNK